MIIGAPAPVTLSAWTPTTHHIRMDSNYDPRDDTHARPQVAFRLRAGACEPRTFFDDVLQHVDAYHDAMLFDAEGGEVRGAVRFGWDAPRDVVDQLAEYLRSLPYVISVSPGYGYPIDAAE